MRAARAREADLASLSHLAPTLSAATRAATSSSRQPLLERLSAIREELLVEAEGWRPWPEGRDSDRDASARNLFQYLALVATIYVSSKTP
jgi:hypothetical protein